MKNLLIFYVFCSFLVTVATSTSEFGFHDIIDFFTSSSTEASTAGSSPQAQTTPTGTAQTSSSSAQTSTTQLRINASFTIGSATTAVSTIESTYKNWVGPAKTPSDTACYREAHIATRCPLEFSNEFESCWAECSLTFPVTCGMECIRQNDDCKLEIVSKVSVVFQSAMSLATLGLYGEFKLMAKGVQTAFKCAKEMANLVKQLSKYVRNIKVTNPQTPQAELLTMLYQTDNMVFDLPVTICTCLGIKVNEKVKFADKVTNTAELVLKEVLANANAIVASWSSLKKCMEKIPIVTNNCMTEMIAESDEATAYATRATLRKTFSGIVEDLIKSETSNNGAYLKAKEYAYKIADKAASFYGVWYVTGITNVLGEYFQTICGPTKFIGDIDDGTAEEALGMTMAGDAFNGSLGTWTKAGDGTVTITFRSSDSDDVTVNIQSGDEKIAEVDVPAGETATWSSSAGRENPLSRSLATGHSWASRNGRWSLLLWIPRATRRGGRLELKVELNAS